MWGFGGRKPEGGQQAPSLHEGDMQAQQQIEQQQEQGQSSEEQMRAMREQVMQEMQSPAGVVDSAAVRSEVDARLTALRERGQQVEHVTPENGEAEEPAA